LQVLASTRGEIEHMSLIHIDHVF